MRTDVVRYPNKRLRTGVSCPIGASTVGRGDVIEWHSGGAEPNVGRIICVIRPKVQLQGDESPRLYLCVAMICGGVVAERWVKPEDVFSASPPTRLLEWLFSDHFLATDIDSARDACNRNVAPAPSQPELV